MGSRVGGGADVKGRVGSAQLGALEGERSERGRERAAAQVERRQLATLLQEAAQREVLVRAEHLGLMSTCALLWYSEAHQKPLLVHADW